VSWLKNAFSVKEEKSREYTEEELAVMDKLVRKVHDYRMQVPALMFLESVKPLNFVASQAMVFFKPFVSAFFSTREYDIFTSLLEERETLEVLLTRIERYEDDAKKREGR
jgi:hypothetical protein